MRPPRYPSKKKPPLLSTLPGPGLSGNRKTEAPRTNQTGGFQAPDHPTGSGFDRVVKQRADIRNRAGRQNAFGDRVPVPKRPGSPAGGYPNDAGYSILARHQINRVAGSTRQGQEYATALDSKGRTVHLYKSGEKVVLKPKKNPTFSRDV